ncbi:hypothetical protein TNCV_4812631 [Trichonephila clavipes]|nr:hypothetical protein TNCV_4812631 [Trichonephila clavipes]
MRKESETGGRKNYSTKGNRCVRASRGYHGCVFREVRMNARCGGKVRAGNTEPLVSRAGFGNVVDGSLQLPLIVRMSNLHN